VTLAVAATVADGARAGDKNAALNVLNRA